MHLGDSELHGTVIISILFFVTPILLKILPLPLWLINMQIFLTYTLELDPSVGIPPCSSKQCHSHCFLNLERVP